MDLKVLNVSRCGPDPSGLGLSPVVDSLEHSNKHSYTREGTEFLGQLNDYQLLKGSDDGVNTQVYWFFFFGLFHRQVF
jgi:hypothetical protein